MGKTNVEEDVEGEDVEGEDVEGEELDTNVLPPNIPMNNETEFQGLLSNLSMKIDTFDKQIEDKMDSQFKKTNPNKALNAFMETMKQNEQKEIDQIIKKMRKYGIETQIGYYALSEQNAFKYNANVRVSKTIKNSLFLAKHTLALPLFYEMNFSQQDFVIKSLNKHI